MLYNMFYFEYIFRNQNENQYSDEIFHEFFLRFGWNPLIYFDVVV